MKIVKNEEAVSPVIGVILMVAITVILAAVIAAFVFNIGTPAATAPKAQLAIIDNSGATVATTTDQYNTLIKVSHKGGDPIVASELRYKLVAPDGEVFDSNVAWATGATGTVSAVTAAHGDQAGSGTAVSGTISVGSDIYLQARAGVALTTADAGTWTVQIIHVPSTQLVLDGKVLVT